MGAASAGVQSPQSSMPAGKGAGTSPSTPAGSTISATSGQPVMGAPNTNSNTGMDLAPASKGGGSSVAGTPASPYAQPASPSSFTNTDASGNPVMPMQVPNQYSNTIGSPNSNMAQADFQTGNDMTPRTPNYLGATATTGDVMDGGRPGAIMRPSGKGAAAGNSQGKGPQ